LRPRYGEGGRERVVGYTVKTDGGEREYGGGRLAKDLTLPKLRERWEQSPDQEREAVAVWRHGRAGPALEVKGRKAWTNAAERVQAVNEHLVSLSPTDTARWSSAAREASGVAGQLAQRLEADRPGPLADAAALLAHSGQRYRRDLQVVRDGPVVDLRGVADVAAQAQLRPVSRRQTARLVGELAQTTDRVAGAHAARGEALSARRLHEASATLVGVASALAVGGRALDRGMAKAIGADYQLEAEDEQEPKRGRSRKRGHDRDFGRD
jgi:hypothetical protein